MPIGSHILWTFHNTRLSKSHGYHQQRVPFLFDYIWLILRHGGVRLPVRDKSLFAERHSGIYFSASRINDVGSSPSRRVILNDSSRNVVYPCCQGINIYLRTPFQA